MYYMIILLIRLMKIIMNSKMNIINLNQVKKKIIIIKINRIDNMIINIMIIKTNTETVIDKLTIKEINRIDKTTINRVKVNIKINTEEINFNKNLKILTTQKETINIMIIIITKIKKIIKTKNTIKITNILMNKELKTLEM